MTESKHLPIFSLLVFQILSLIILVSLAFTFLFGSKNPKHLSTILSIIMIACSVVDVVFIIFSLFVAINVPLVFDSKGIVKRTGRKKTRFLWSDAEKIQMIVRGHSNGCGPKYIRIKIIFRNKSVLKFEPTGLINRDILCFCKNQKFLEMFEKCVNGDQ